MTKHLPKTHLKKIVFSIFLFCAISIGHSQELKFFANGEILGGVSNPFLGPGVGLESSIGKHFTMNVDLHVGFNENGTAYQFRPAVHYYFSKEQKGIFVGPSLKYIRFTEKDNLDLFHDNVYTVGFTLGVKSYIKENLSYIFSVAPHYAIGASTSPGRQALGSIGGIGFNFGIGYRF
jgi:hypothetical protein